jgi:transposase-like protein
VHCGSVTVVRFGYPAGPQRLCFKVCGMTFMALTGTPVQRWREPEEWVACMDCMNQGLTLRASAAAVGLMID